MGSVGGEWRRVGKRGGRVEDSAWEAWGETECIPTSVHLSDNKVDLPCLHMHTMFYSGDAWQESGGPLL